MAACLDAQGKLEVLFTFLCLEERESYLAVADGGDPEENMSQLLRFKVADRFEVEMLSNFSLVHLSTDLPETQKSLQSELTPIWSIPSKRLFNPGADLIIPSHELGDVISKIPSEVHRFSTQELVASRILGNRPWFPDDLHKRSLFLEAEALNAISSTKGCYAGQEVIEKGRARGKAPAVITPFSIVGESLNEGDALICEASGKRLGELITRSEPISEEFGYAAFVRLRSEFLDSHVLKTSGATLTRLDRTLEN